MNFTTFRHHLTCILAGAAATLLVPALASAVPSQVTQQGRLVDDTGDGLSGSHSIEFTLFSDSANATPVWSESHTLELDNGYYSVTLGADPANPLDDSVLSLDALYLGMTVDNGTLMQPLLEVTSAPYAIMAGNLDGGYADASEIYIDGTLVVDAVGDWVGNVLPGTLASLGCADGEAARYTTASGWACVAPGDHFTSTDAVAAMGTADPTNPLNHIRYSDSDAVAAMGSAGSTNALNHGRYADSEAVAAMGSAGSSNLLNHDRYADSEAVAAMGSAGSSNLLNHERYADSEAVAAMGGIGDSNPLNHDRYSSTDIVSAVGTENLLTNSSFQIWSRVTQPDGWFFSGAVLAADTGSASAGATAIAMGAGNAGDYVFATIDNYAEYAGHTVTFAIDIDDGGVGASIEIDDGGSPSTASYSGTGSQRVIVSHTVSASPTRLGVRVLAGGAGTLILDGATLAYGNHSALPYRPESAWTTRQRTLAYYQSGHTDFSGNDHSENTDWYIPYEHKASGTVTGQLTSLDLYIWHPPYSGDVTQYTGVPAGTTSGNANSGEVDCNLNTFGAREVRLHCETGGQWQTNSEYGVLLGWQVWVEQTW